MTRDQRTRAKVQRTLTPVEEGAIAPDPDAEAHWKCPDCFMPCYCVGPARLMDHNACGVAVPGSKRFEQLDDAVRRSYESWVRAGAVPGGHE